MYETHVVRTKTRPQVGSLVAMKCRGRKLGLVSKGVGGETQ